MSIKRNPNIEYLRIISMFMILMLHSNGHGGVLDNYEYGTFGYVLFWLVESFCMVSVNTFILITGYYGTSSKFKASKLLKFFIEVAAFSVLCTAIVRVIFSRNVGLKDWLYAIMPLTSNRYWFASNYALLLLIQPILNAVIQRADKIFLKRVIYLMIFLFSGLPTFLIWNREIAGTGMNIIWFIILYLVGAYIHLYGLNYGENRWFLLYILLIGMLFISDIVVPWISKTLLGYVAGVGIFNYYNTLFVLCASVCFFMLFVSKKKLKYNRLMMSMASIGTFVFGAYLISDHRIIRSILWEMINLSGFSKEPLVVLLYMILVNIGILILGIILDVIIKRLINQKSLKRLYTIIDRKIQVLDLSQE